MIGGPINRVSKWTKDGRFIMAFGKSGKGHGEFDVPHALALDCLAATRETWLGAAASLP